MTDGIPNVPWSSAERHRQEILKANFSRIKIDVFGIALNQNGSKAINYVAKEFCRRVSSDTGGTFFDLH
jgi:hypothetical protein